MRGYTYDYAGGNAAGYFDGGYYDHDGNWVDDEEGCVCVCVCACVCVDVYIYIYIYICVCLCVRLCVCM
jgi:hypothetical protein